MAGVLAPSLEVLQQEELPQVAQQVADELRVVGAVVGEALDELEGRRPCRGSMTMSVISKRRSASVTPSASSTSAGVIAARRRT